MTMNECTDAPTGRDADLCRKIVSDLQRRGLDVYMMPTLGGGSPTSNSYACFTDGTRIGYVQWGRGEVKWTSCHQPSREVGTGFEATGAVNAMTMICPGWASHHAGHVKKWSSWEAYHEQSPFHRGYVRIGAMA